MPNSSRHHARITAFQIIYNRSRLGIIPESEALFIDQASLSKEHREFCNKLVATIFENKSQIDLGIQKHLKHWKQNRISESLNAVLKLGTCELLFTPELDAKVALNESIEICKAFVGEKATKICNGVLHAVSQERLDPKENM